MNQVHEFSLSLKSKHTDGVWDYIIDLPEGPSILSAKYMYGDIVVWASVNPGEHIITKHQFIVAHTGVYLPTWCNKSTHIDTVSHRPTIYHVFARTV